MVYFVSNDGSDDNAGSMPLPWKTLEYAVDRLSAGDILYIRGGEYKITEAAVITKSSSADQPIVVSAYPFEEVVINGEDVNFYKESEKYPFAHETGVVFIYRSSHLIIRNIRVINSHGHGIAVRDSDNVTITGCTTENTFACGISIWDTKSTAAICHHNKIIDNTVIKANTWDMLPDGMARGNEPPHEAISIAGACFFEVCFNHVYQCDKEGIDVKENASYGTVHHNHVHHVDRQGLYADAWFGPLKQVEFYENNVHDCKGAGIVVSVEQGHSVSGIRIYNNTVRENWGTGILFGTWGADGPRFDIDIFNNVVVSNGHGTPAKGYNYFWITGGLCLLSANITDCKIHNNIFHGNKGFDIGYSSAYIKDGESIESALEQKKIAVFENVIVDEGKQVATDYPINTDFEDSVLYGLSVTSV